MAGMLQFSGDPHRWIYRPNVVYECIDGCKRTLQILGPMDEGQNDTRYPLIVFVLGSGWRKQALYNPLPCLSALSLRGFVVALVEYRETALATFPAQVHDAKRAVTFLLEHAKDYLIDPDQVFLMGNSSGAHTALLAAYTAQNGLLNPPDQPNWHCDVRGVLDLSGPVDMKLQMETPPPPHLPDARFVIDLLGTEDPVQLPGLLKASSVDTYVTSAPLPPTLIIQGTDDRVVMPENSLLLERKLKEHGHAVEAWLIEGAGHSGAPYWSNEMVDLMERFIRQYC